MGQAPGHNWHSPNATFAAASEVVRGIRPLLWIARRVEPNSRELWEFRDQIPLGFGNVIPLDDPTFLLERHDCLDTVKSLEPNHAALRESKDEAWKFVELTDDLDIEFMRKVDAREVKSVATAAPLANDELACVFLRWEPGGLTPQQVRSARTRFALVGQVPLGEFRRLMGSHSEMVAAEGLRWFEASQLAAEAIADGLDVEVRSA
ncbi:MAG: hypothetical protein M5U25_16150 [Planctomycetota bacterium]|nr:hypothetical protein [Planctomycetota bacterium]